MREIKFRGYSKDYKNWYYGFLSKEYNEEEEDYYYIDYEFGSPRVEEESIGQYTGFKDKNGKEIYEGDIIQVCRGTKRICEDMEFIVEFSKAGMWEVIEKRYRMDRWDFVDYYENSKVIGNIYEEKLKEGK